MYLERLIDIQRKLVPDVLEVMSNRYRILQSLSLLQPIGRRALSANLGMTERVLRSEVTFLSQQGLLYMATNGMRLTAEGENVVHDLDDVMKDVSGIRELENQLEKELGLSRVIVVPGDSDQSPWVKDEMGKVAIDELEHNLKEKSIIAVTGGTTVAAIANAMHPIKKRHEDLLFVSARGGLGEQVENQANTICAKMAEKAEGRYRLLHVPDQLREESYHTLMEEPSVKEAVRLLNDASLIIHGIGDAKTMATRRQSSQEMLEKIDREEAVAEAFGYYFDSTGHVVHKVKTIGIQLEGLYDNRTVIAVAGGKSKGPAIKAYFKKGPDSILVTDEGAALDILNN